MDLLQRVITCVMLLSSIIMTPIGCMQCVERQTSFIATPDFMICATVWSKGADTYIIVCDKKTNIVTSFFLKQGRALGFQFVCFSHDGKKIMLGSANGLFFLDRQTGVIRAYDKIVKRQQQIQIYITDVVINGCLFVQFTNHIIGIFGQDVKVIKATKAIKSFSCSEDHTDLTSVDLQFVDGTTQNVTNFENALQVEVDLAEVLSLQRPQPTLSFQQKESLPAREHNQQSLRIHAVPFSIPEPYSEVSVPEKRKKRRYYKDVFKKNEKEEFMCPYNNCDYAKKRSQEVVCHIRARHDPNFNLKTFDRVTADLSAFIPQKKRGRPKGRKGNKRYEDVFKKNEKEEFMCPYNCPDKYTHKKGNYVARHIRARHNKAFSLQEFDAKTIDLSASILRKKRRKSSGEKRKRVDLIEKDGDREEEKRKKKERKKAI